VRRPSIRHPPDADANIIVGATFDDSLEGIIRVSVVATSVGMNAANAPLRVSPTESLAHAPR
jgi:cell division protein FtsZ